MSNTDPLLDDILKQAAIRPGAVTPDSPIPSGVFSMADRYRELDEKKKALKAELSEIQEALDTTEAAMAQEMINEEIQNFSRGGKTFYLQQNIYVSSIPDLRPDLFNTLKGRGHGDLIQETINANTLRAWTKEQMAENDDEVPEWLEGYLNVSRKPGVGMRKSR